MSTGAISAQLSTFFEKLLGFLQKCREAPRIMWEGASGEPGGRLFIIFVFIVFSASILYVLYAFIKAKWKEKLKMLFTGLIVLAVLFLIFWNVL